MGERRDLKFQVAVEGFKHETSPRALKRLFKKKKREKKDLIRAKEAGNSRTEKGLFCACASGERAGARRRRDSVPNPGAFGRVIWLAGEESKITGCVCLQFGDR